LLFAEPFFKKRAGVHARRGVTLEINLIAPESTLAAAAEEMIERNLVQSGG
jgi:hypothetical protein